MPEGEVQTEHANAVLYSRKVSAFVFDIGQKMTVVHSHHVGAHPCTSNLCLSCIRRKGRIGVRLRRNSSCIRPVHRSCRCIAAQASLSERVRVLSASLSLYPKMYLPLLNTRSICLNKALTTRPACLLKVAASTKQFQTPEHWREHVKGMAGGKQRALHRCKRRFAHVA